MLLILLRRKKKNFKITSAILPVKSASALKQVLKPPHNQPNLLNLLCLPLPHNLIHVQNYLTEKCAYSQKSKKDVIRLAILSIL